MSESLSPFARGLSLLSALRDLHHNGATNFAAAWPEGIILVGMGLAEFDLPYEEGEPYWLRITHAGRAMTAALASPAP